jgi:hypothetical protein
MIKKTLLATLVLSFVLCVGWGFCADVYQYYAPLSYNMNPQYIDTPKPILCVYKYDDTADDGDAAQLIRYYYDTTTSANVKIDQGEYEIRSLLESEVYFSLMGPLDADGALQSWFESNWTP